MILFRGTRHSETGHSVFRAQSSLAEPDGFPQAARLNLSLNNDYRERIFLYIVMDSLYSVTSIVKIDRDHHTKFIKLEIIFYCFMLLLADLITLNEPKVYFLYSKMIK